MYGGIPDKHSKKGSVLADPISIKRKIFSKLRRHIKNG